MVFDCQPTRDPGVRCSRFVRLGLHRAFVLLRMRAWASALKHSTGKVTNCAGEKTSSQKRGYLHTSSTADHGIVAVPISDVSVKSWSVQPKVASGERIFLKRPIVLRECAMNTDATTATTHSTPAAMKPTSHPRSPRRTSDTSAMTMRPTATTYTEESFR